MRTSTGRVSLIMGCIAVLFAVAYGVHAADCEFASVTLAQIYERLVNGQSADDVYVWDVADSVSIVNCGGQVFSVRIRGDRHYLPTQVRINGNIDCPELKKRLPRPSESFGLGPRNKPASGSVFVYVMPVEDWCILDSFECVSWAGPLRRPTSQMSMDESGYEFFYAEDLSCDSLAVTLVTKKMFNTGGYSIHCDRSLASSGDTVYLRPGVASPTAAMVTQSFAPAGGSCRIALEPPEYTLTILEHADSISFDIRITNDSISVSPTELSDIDLMTNPHRRLPHNLVYVLLTNWPESGWSEYAKEVKSQFAQCGAMSTVLGAGDYGRFALDADSVNYFRRHSNRYNTGKPVLFFVADSVTDELGAACEKLFASGKDKDIVAHFFSFEGKLPTMMEIVDHWGKRSKQK